MNDIATATAAAVPAGQVAIEPAAAAPQPLSTENNNRAGNDQGAPKPAPSTRDALRAAAEQVEKDNPADGSKPAAKPADKAAAGDAKDLSKGAALERGDGGRFTAKENGKQPTAAEAASAAAAAATPEARAAAAAASKAAGGDQPGAVKHAAPERFSADAKAAWDTAPEPVKAEVHRALREMEAGIEKHRSAAQKFETVKDFDELATRSQTTLRTALERYVNTEQLLRTNPLKGLDAICNQMGISLRQVAETVMGQAPDQRAAQSDGEIRELRATVARLEQQVGGVTQTFEQQGQQKLYNDIAKWSEGKVHFELLAPHIAEAVAAGANLDDAYQGALAKFPGLSAGKPPANDETTRKAAEAAAEAHEAQNLKGSRSIAGARSGPGSEPVDNRRPSTIRESLRRAAAQA